MCSKISLFGRDDNIVLHGFAFRILKPVAAQPSEAHEYGKKESFVLGPIGRARVYDDAVFMCFARRAEGQAAGHLFFGSLSQGFQS